MASALRAAARATLLSLRREVASIEGAPPACAGGNEGWSGGERGAPRALLQTGAADFDEALGGGLDLAGLLEFHVREARDAGPGTGFLTSLLSLANAPDFLCRDPVLWIGGPGTFFEGGAPYGRGLRMLGFAPERLLLVEPKRLADALWIAEEGAHTRGLAAVIVDMRGQPGLMGLRETQRLHRRAQATGRPVLLLRQSAEPEPTAAPLRLAVSPAPSAQAMVLAGTAHARAVPGGIGPPGFSVTIEKNKTGPAGRTFLLHWNSHERHFYTEQSRSGFTRRAGTASAAAGKGAALLEFPRTAHSGAELSLSSDRPDRARALGERLAADAGKAS
jgi:protein ImuA